jgi:hypothetical protein
VRLTESQGQKNVSPAAAEAKEGDGVGVVTYRPGG